MSTAAADSDPATSHFRITLRRSAIGLPSHTSRVLEALGLHRRLQSVYQAHSQSAVGAILAVKELVHVENVRPLDSTDEITKDTIWVNANGDIVDAGKRSRKAPPGFRVVGNLIDEERDAVLKRGA